MKTNAQIRELLEKKADKNTQHEVAMELYRRANTWVESSFNYLTKETVELAC